MSSSVNTWREEHLKVFKVVKFLEKDINNPFSWQDSNVMQTHHQILG